MQVAQVRDRREAATNMDGPSTDGLLEAADVMAVEGDDASEKMTPRRISTGDQNSRLGISYSEGEGDGEDAAARQILSSSYQRPPKFGNGMTEDGGAMNVEGDDKGEEATPRRSLSSYTPSSQRPTNYRKKFLTPRDIKTEMQMENSQLQPGDLQQSPFGQNLEDETESTASSPQPPLPRGKANSSLPTIARPEPAGIRRPENRPARDTSAKTSPLKINKPVKIRRRSSRTTSDVWDYFTQKDTEDGSIATCSFCGQVYQCDRSFHGTSTLRGHLQYRCPSCPFTDHDKRRKVSLRDNPRFSAEDCRRALARMIIMDEYPFSAVEGEGFKQYSKTLQPQFEPPSRYTVARDCLNLYLEEKAKLKEILRHQRVCLTTDTWTSIQNQNYMSLTAHWINSQWKLERKVLNFCFVPNHAGDTLGRMIEECLLEWDIGQIFTLTVDNAASNNTAIQYLKTVTKDWESTICNNEFLHVRCCAHIVNLVVKKGWEATNASVARIRTAVLFAKSSPGRLGLFKRCVQKEKIMDMSLFSLDVDTRWNSTYLMLEDTIPFEKAFTRLGEDSKYYKSYFSRVGGPPSAKDWLEARKLVSVFKLFYNVTMRFSRQMHVTSTSFFQDFLLMHNKIALLIHGKKEEPGLGLMAENMKQKFDKYWDNHDGLNLILFIAVALDPRYKLKYLDFCFSHIYDKDKAKSFTRKIEDGLTRLFEWYAEAESTANITEAHHAPVLSNLEEYADDPRKLWASNFKEHLQVIESKAANTELSRFLSEFCEKDTDEFDILDWWRKQRSKYPTLSKVAKDVLAVPVSTIASESSFSTGGRVISPQRSSLSPKMVEALICGQSWLRSSPNKIDIRQTLDDLHKYEELAQELGALECGDT